MDSASAPVWMNACDYVNDGLHTARTAGPTNPRQPHHNDWATGGGQELREAVARLSAAVAAARGKLSEVLAAA